MARPVWTGTISFGMVSIPIKLVPAVRRRTVTFNQLDADTMSRIRYRKVSDATGEEVPAERIVRAASLGADRYAVIQDEELDAITPERSRELSIETFIDEDHIDPIRYDATYHALPDEYAKPYALLAHALGGTGRVGLGRFVMRRREHLAAIRSDGRLLQVTTLAFADEVVDPSGWEEFEVLDDVELADRERSMAETLVEAMSGDEGVLDSVDEFHAAVEELIAAKSEGATVTTEPAATSERSANVVDLASALEASLAGAREAKGRHPSARGSARRSSGTSETATKNAAAKKATTKKAGATKKPATKKPATKKAAARKQPATRRRAS